MKIKRIAQSFISIIGLSACSGEAVNKIHEVASLQGSYQTEIIKDLSIRVGGIGCLVHEMNISTNNISIIQTAYDDLLCRGDAIGKIITNGTFSIREELAISPGARALDLKIEKISIRPLHDSWLMMFGIDFSGLCNIQDTPIGESRDVSGLDCGAFGRMPAKGQVYFTSYSLHDDILEFTVLPQESIKNVGSEQIPAPRNQELTVKYYSK